jgi:hypothetical protein
METTKVMAVVPLLPSATDAEATDTVGAASLSTIVPVAVDVPSVASTGAEILTVSVSVASCSVSPTTGTLKVALSDPAGIVTAPLDAV